MGLAHPKRSGNEPCHAPPLRRDDFPHDRVLAERRARPGLTQFLKKHRVLATAAAKCLDEAWLRGSAQKAAFEENVTGIAIQHGPIRPEHRPGRVQIGLPDPGRPVRIVNRLYRAEHDICAIAFKRLDQGREPAWLRRFIVVDEGDERCLGMRQARIPGDRNIARRCVHEQQREVAFGADPLGQIARGGGVVIIDDDSTKSQRFRQNLACDRPQRCFQRVSAERADADVHAAPG